MVRLARTVRRVKRFEPYSLRDMFEELNKDPGEEGLKRAARIFFVLAALSLIGLVIYLVLALMSGKLPVLQLGINAGACAVAYLTGRGIEDQRPWAKWAGIILGILELFNFP